MLVSELFLQKHLTVCHFVLLGITCFRAFTCFRVFTQSRNSLCYATSGFPNSFIDSFRYIFSHFVTIWIHFVIRLHLYIGSVLGGRSYMKMLSHQNRNPHLKDRISNIWKNSFLSKGSRLWQKVPFPVRAQLSQAASLIGPPLCPC